MKQFLRNFALQNEKIAPLWSHCQFSNTPYSAKVLTKFVDGSPIAKFIKGEMRKRNIDYEGVEAKPGGS